VPTYRGGTVVAQVIGRAKRFIARNAKTNSKTTIKDSPRPSGVVFLLRRVSSGCYSKSIHKRKKEEMIHNIASPNGSYFAEDGSYGSAGQLAVIDTSDWDDHDWQLIESASDDERVYVAREIGVRRWEEHKKS